MKVRQSKRKKLSTKDKRFLQTYPLALIVTALIHFCSLMMGIMLVLPVIGIGCYIAALTKLSELEKSGRLILKHSLYAIITFGFIGTVSINIAMSITMPLCAV